VDQAKTEIQKGNWGLAWVLLANQDIESTEKQTLETKIRSHWQDALVKAQAQSSPRLVKDLEANLALSAGKSWIPPRTPETGSASKTSTNPDDWLKGTVTVIVNRGLKVENGSASPDIVIGSGFFISDDGYLLTNHHVIESEVEPTDAVSSKLSIRLPGSRGERLPARVVGWDKNMDLALLKAEYHPPFVFRLSTDSDPVPGEKLQVLGSPGGLESTLTQGIVSAVKRPLLSVGEVLQIDAAVNPGNSGGPMVDADGRVLGVVFAGIRGFQGVNFAIPTSLVRLDLPRLQVGGRAVLPWMGLGFQEDMHGTTVVYIVPRGPGDWSGVHLGDRLVAVGGVPVSDLNAAQIRLLDFGISAVVPLDWERDGKPIRLWTTLAQRPDDPLKIAAMNDLAQNVLPLAFGVAVDDVGPGVDSNFRVTKVWPGTAGDELSLTPNDPIQVLDWLIDTKNHALLTRWKLKRRLGGYLDSVVSLGAPYESRLFL